MKSEKIDRESALQEIEKLSKECPNVVAFFFFDDRPSQVITATDDKSYDEFATAAAMILDKMTRKQQKAKQQ